MKSFMSSNCSYYETSKDEQATQVKKAKFTLQPYQSMQQRFKQVLRKGEPILIHLMLKQASQTKNKQLLRNMLKALVSQAAKSK